jgi:hypothetical protein
MIKHSSETRHLFNKPMRPKMILAFFQQFWCMIDVMNMMRSGTSENDILVSFGHLPVTRGTELHLLFLNTQL